MTEMFGISVIDDSQASQKSDELGVGITAIVRIKHAALYEAAKAMGGASALARHLGVRDTMIGEWINLKSCPPRDGSAAKLKSWTEERIAIMEAKLEQLTGKSWEELWPDELRENHEFLKSPKTMEKVFNWKQAAMLSYAEVTRSRLLEQSGNEPCNDEQRDLEKESVEKVLHLLSYRERLVISHRFGFNGEPKHLSEVGEILKITRESVRQIETKAINKLRRYAGLAMVGKVIVPQSNTLLSWDENVCDMGFPGRLIEALHGAKIKTLKDLSEKTEKQIRKIKGSSTYWVTLVKRALHRRGIDLAEEAEKEKQLTEVPG